MRTIFLSIILLCACLTAQPSYCQEGQQQPADSTHSTHSTHSQFSLSAEAQLSASTGRTPLWLNANRYGLSSLDELNGYTRATATWRSAALAHGTLTFDATADIALAAHYTSTLVIQQAYGAVHWLKGSLTIGAKEQPLNLKSQTLSSGSQTLGKNARPVPEVRLSLDDYWTFLRLWGFSAAFRGHLAYGRYTDDKWQQSFTAEAYASALAAGSNKDERYGRYCDDVLYHSKSGFVRIGSRKPEQHAAQWWKNLSVEMGAEMASQFGGKCHYIYYDGTPTTTYCSTSLSSFIHALTSGGQDARDGAYGNEEVYLLGAAVARISYRAERWHAALYYDHFFEDLSGMILLDYDGYGTGDEWNTRVSNTYYAFPLRDFMLGAELGLPTPYARTIVMEYLYSKYQSGPYNHDRTPAISDHLAGQDDYYNHSIYNAYQHWGQVQGNPLYLSPIYNSEGVIVVSCNRMKALHLGIEGQLPAIRDLHCAYRFLSTYQQGWGTYLYPYSHRKDNLSLMLEMSTTQLPATNRHTINPWTITLALALDRGALRGNNSGAQITLRRVIL